MSKPPRSHAIAEYCDAYGILLRRDAIEKGIDDKALARLVDAKVMIKPRQGIYILRAVFLAADEAERHRLLCRAVIQLYGDHVALSGVSSVLMQNGPDWGLDLRNVHLNHASGGGRRQSRIIHHTADVTVVDERYHQDLRVSVPARAVVEVACTEGVEAALVQANHFLHLGEMTMDELHAQAERARQRPGSLFIHPVLLLADERIESVGETRVDYLAWQAGLARPVPQYEVAHLNGTVAARVDFAWPRFKLIIEFDGRTKYHRHRREGETIEQMVEREKKREDLIRELTGWTVIRLTWADLDMPVRTAARIRRAMQLEAA